MLVRSSSVPALAVAVALTRVYVVSFQFESVALDLKAKTFTVNHHGHVAVVNHETTVCMGPTLPCRTTLNRARCTVPASQDIKCDNDALLERVKQVLRRTQTALYPTLA